MWYSSTRYTASSQKHELAVEVMTVLQYCHSIYTDFKSVWNFICTTIIGYKRNNREGLFAFLNVESPSLCWTEAHYISPAFLLPFRPFEFPLEAEILFALVLNGKKVHCPCFYHGQQICLHIVGYPMPCVNLFHGHPFCGNITAVFLSLSS